MARRSLWQSPVIEPSFVKKHLETLVIGQSSSKQLRSSCNHKSPIMRWTLNIPNESSIVLYFTELTCNPPPSINFTEVTYSDVSVGAVAHYQCSAGYKYSSGDSQLGCSIEQMWVGEHLKASPQCKE